MSFPAKDEMRLVYGGAETLSREGPMKSCLGSLQERGSQMTDTYRRGLERGL